MKKFLAMLCAVALAALCAVSAFAEATPGQAANEAGHQHPEHRQQGASWFPGC